VGRPSWVFENAEAKAPAEIEAAILRMGMARRGRRQGIGAGHYREEITQAETVRAKCPTTPHPGETRRRREDSGSGGNAAGAWAEPQIAEKVGAGVRREPPQCCKIRP